ncbi:MAG TPA: hypothetical protein VHD91_11110 [Gaiellaceae bacterium]|nr:hypothetical protein [Gaiellaceae bacterium]
MFVGLVAAAVLAAAPVGVVLSERGHGLATGCVSTLQAGFMGGQTVTYCGKQAIAACLGLASADQALAAACRRQRLAVGP